MAPQTHIPLHQMCHRQCFWILSIWVFAMNNAKKCGGCSVAPLTCIRQHQMCHQQCFWILIIALFEMRNGKNCGSVGVAPQMCMPLHQICHQQRFWIPSMSVFEMHKAKKIEGLAWRPKRAYLCTTYASNSVFGYPVWVCLKCRIPKSVGSWRGAPCAHTSAPKMPALVFLDTQYGGV